MSLAARATEDRATLGILMTLGAWGLFSVTDTSAKWLVLAGYSALQVAFFRYAVHLVVVLAEIGKGGMSWDRFETDRPWQLIGRGMLIVVSTVFNFVALGYLPLSVVAAIMFSSPLFACLLSPFLLNERVGPVRLAAVLAGFVGVLIVMRPFGGSFHWAMALSLSNALCLALYSIVTRRLADKVAPETMQLYMGIPGTVLLALPLPWIWRTPESALDLFLLILLGATAWSGHELLTRALRYAGATTLTPFTYSFILYLTVSGFLVFGVVPDGYTVLGAAVVAASGLVIWWRERRKGGGAPIRR